MRVTSIARCSRRSKSSSPQPSLGVPGEGVRAMNPILIHVGSGGGFFSGMGIVALAVCLAYLLPNRWMLAGCDVAAAAGMLLVGLSSTPTPPMVLPLWCIVTLLALAALHVRGIAPRA